MLEGLPGSEERRKYGECEWWCFAFKNFQTRLKHRGHLCVPVLSLSCKFKTCMRNATLKHHY